MRFSHRFSHFFKPSKTNREDAEEVRSATRAVLLPQYEMREQCAIAHCHDETTPFSWINGTVSPSISC